MPLCGVQTAAAFFRQCRYSYLTQIKCEQFDDIHLRGKALLHVCGQAGESTFGQSKLIISYSAPPQAPREFTTCVPCTAETCHQPRRRCGVCRAAAHSLVVPE